MRNASRNTSGNTLRDPIWICVVIVGLLAGPFTAVAADVNFESPPVHPIELSPSGDYLFIAHTADHRLVVYFVGGGTHPKPVAQIMVGLEPVSVRATTIVEATIHRFVRVTRAIARLSDSGLRVGSDQYTNLESDALGSDWPEISTLDLILPVTWVNIGTLVD